MEVSVTDAKGRLTELVRRAEAGDEIVLTRHGRPAVRMVPVRTGPPTDPEERARIIRRIVDEAQVNIRPGPPSAELQASLYDDDGLPA